MISCDGGRQPPANTALWSPAPGKSSMISRGWGCFPPADFAAYPLGSHARGKTQNHSGGYPQLDRPPDEVIPTSPHTGSGSRGKQRKPWGQPSPITAPSAGWPTCRSKSYRFIHPSEAMSVNASRYYPARTPSPVRFRLTATRPPGYTIIVRPTRTGKRLPPRGIELAPCCKLSHHLWEPEVQPVTSPTKGMTGSDGRGGPYPSSTYVNRDLQLREMIDRATQEGALSPRDVLVSLAYGNLKMEYPALRRETIEDLVK